MILNILNEDEETEQLVLKQVVVGEALHHRNDMVEVQVADVAEVVHIKVGKAIEKLLNVIGRLDQVEELVGDVVGVDRREGGQLVISMQSGNGVLLGQLLTRNIIVVERDAVHQALKAV